MNFTSDTWWLFGIIITAAVAIIGFFLVRTINQLDSHAKAIGEIQRTYVTKEELKDVKSDINNSMSKLQVDVAQIKENCLTKSDFYRLQMQTDKKIDKIYDLLIKRDGGFNNDT